MTEKAPSSRTSGSDNHRHQIRNEVLLSLPGKELDFVLPTLEPIATHAHDVQHEAGERITSCYFINSGVTSMLNVLREGKTIEVGIVGKEGFVGLPLVFGFSSATGRAITQVAGSAFRISAANLKRSLAACPELTLTLGRLSLFMAMQASQAAACNGVHPMDQRLARWLLMCRDRVGSDSLDLTQEFLADMLGTRRATVSVAAGMLQKAGLIRHKRGRVDVLDPEGLKKVSCECYQTINEHSQKWQKEIA